MIDQQPSKRLRAHLDESQLSVADQLAFKRVAELLNKPLSELYEDGLHHETTSEVTENTMTKLGPDEDSSYEQIWPDPSRQSQTMNEVRDAFGGSEFDHYSFQPNGSWTQSSGTSFEDHNSDDATFNRWTKDTSQMSPTQVGHTNYAGDYNNNNPHHSSGWSHAPTAEEPWVSIPTDYLTRASFEVEVKHTLGVSLESPAQGHTSKAVGGQSPDRDFLFSTVELDEFDEVDLDWEVVKPKVASSGLAMPSLGASMIPEGSMKKPSKTHDIFLFDDSNPKSAKWVRPDSSGKELVPKLIDSSAQLTKVTQAEHVKRAKTFPSRRYIRCHAFDIRSQSALFIALAKLLDWNLPSGGQ